MTRGGYQCVGYFAPTARYGTPEDLKYFVDRMHRAGIAVILDWVPAHFCKDEHGLIDFDGTCLYEYGDPLKREHAGWGTRVFDFGRGEVRSFLLSSAAWWLREYHMDGLRVDAVASMLYLDYDRQEWRPNVYGGHENLEAISFFAGSESDGRRHGSAGPDGGGGVHGVAQGHMACRGGRSGLRPQVEHGVDERHLPLSENGSVVPPVPPQGCDLLHGVRLLGAVRAAGVPRRGGSHEGLPPGKMPGDDWRQLAGVRGFYLYLLAHPGKKLTFMGTELAQWHEWDFAGQLDWYLLEQEDCRRTHECIRALNRFYRKNRPLWENDSDWNGFEWLVADDNHSNVIVFLRRDRAGHELVCAVNFSPEAWEDYRFGVPGGQAVL